MEAFITCEEGIACVDEARIRHLVQFAADSLGLPEPSEVSISFVTDEHIAEMNDRFRGKTGPTDVLSFECDNLDDGFPMDGDMYEAGDIIIAPAVAMKQAQELGHSFEEEVDLLIVHGLLHLQGYDHVDDDDAALMQQVQDGILSKWHVHQLGALA